MCANTSADTGASLGVGIGIGTGNSTEDRAGASGKRISKKKAGLELIKGSGRLVLLKLLAENLDKEYTISALSKETGVAFGTTWYTIQDWTRAGITKVRKIGKANIVSIDNVDYARKLIELAEIPSPEETIIKKPKPATEEKEWEKRDNRDYL